MHSIVVTLAALLLLALELLGIGSPPAVTLAIVTVSVALIGIPHGGADHRVGKKLLRPALGERWALLFFSIYLCISIGVLVSWHAFPIQTILAFFVVAAWHFGLEERDEVDFGVMSNSRAIACGGLVIWIPCLMQGPEVARLLQITTAEPTVGASTSVVATVAAFGPLLGGLVLADCLLEIRGVVLRRTDVSPASLRLPLRTLRCVAFVMLFGIADPLVSFALYFSGWHSIRGLLALSREYRRSFWPMAKLLAPLSILALLLVGAGAFMWSSGQTLSDTTVRTLFLGLSALAVPHLILHVIADWALDREADASNLSRGLAT